MINLYEPKTKEFNRNGIANLRNMISCIVTEELNGVYQLDAEHPLPESEHYDIKPGSILKVNSGYDQPQLFRIKRKTPNLKTMKLYAEHISYDLRDNNLLDVYPQNLNGNNALNWILTRTQVEHNFSSFSDISKIGTARYVDKNPIQAIIGDEDNSFAKIWGGEIVRDNFMIKMLEKRGNDFGYKLTKTKNITGLEFDEDISEVVTRVIPKAFNGIKLPEGYVDSPLIENYPHPIIKEIEFPDIKLKDENSDEGYETVEEVYAALKESVQKQFESGLDKPKINVKVNFVELSKTIEYEKYQNLETLHMGDYITLICDNYNLKLRVVKTKFNSLLGRYIEIELGNFKQTFFDFSKQSIQKLENQMIKVHFPSYLTQAKNAATEQLISAMGGFVYKTQNELFIMDSNNPLQAVKVWRWNLNGLGYSKTGVNGPYETAITQDGQIVADFITAGKISTDRIEGFNDLLLEIRNAFDFLRKNESKNQVQLDDALQTRIQKLIVKGYSQPQLSAYPGLNYPGLSKPSSFIENEINTLVITIDTQPKSNPSVNKKNYILNIKEPLRYFEGVFDTVEINADGKAALIRRLKIENDRLLILSNPIVEEIGTLDVQLFQGANYIYTNDSNYTLYAEYLFNNELNKNFATKMDLSSAINMTETTINILSENKTDKNHILAEINLTTQTDFNGSEIQMSADKMDFKNKIFNLESENITITSPNFKVSPDGTIEAVNGKFSGTITGSNITGGNIKGSDIELVDEGTLSSSKFHIKNKNTGDNINIGSNMIQLVGDNSLFYVFLTEETKNMGYIMNVAEALTLKYNGNLYTRGDYLCEKDITCNSLHQMSDRRKKTNIKKLKFNFIDDLDVKTFDFKKKFGGSKNNIGIIANDYIDKEYADYLIKQNEDGYYSVNYQAITMCLVDKVQKLEERIKRLEEK